MDFNIFKLSYNRRNGTSLAFIILSLFSSAFKSTERKVLFILYALNIIDRDFVKYHKSKITREFLLIRIFKHTKNDRFISKEIIRHFVGLKSRETFNEYFNAQFLKLNLSKRRFFTLEETYLVLTGWYGEDKWLINPPVNKKQMAAYFTGGDYEKLEFEVTSYLNNFHLYKTHRYFRPTDIKRLLIYFESINPEKVINFNKDKPMLDDIEIILWIFLYRSYKNTFVK